MKKKIFLWSLAMLLLLPCVLRAEEIEIQLMEVIEMTQIPGNDPLDDGEHMGSTPTIPTSFRATINGTSLSINRQDNNIPSAQATVVNAANGSIVLNQQFTSSLLSQIANSGMYILHIQTASGALFGQFVVQ